MSVYQFTSIPEIESVFSSAGITWRLDDDRTGTLSSAENSYGEDVIDEATDWILMYVQYYYTEADLVSNSWIRRQASIYACHLLSQRRGNPAQFEDAIAKLTKVLDEIRWGKLKVPALPYSENYGPTVSTQVVDRRFQVAKLKVLPTISAGDDVPQQDVDVGYPGGGFYDGGW